MGSYKRIVRATRSAERRDLYACAESFDARSPCEKKKPLDIPIESIILSVEYDFQIANDRNSAAVVL
jgi:hypothetical protein